eukprot:403358863
MNASPVMRQEENLEGQNMNTEMMNFNQQPRQIPFTLGKLNEEESFQMLKKTIQTSQNWLIYAIMGAISLASHNYIISEQMGKKNNSAYIYSEFMSFITLPLSYHIYYGYNNWQKRGIFWQKRQSQLFKITGSNTFKLDWYKINMLGLRGILQVMIPINTSLIAYYSIKADFSVGAMYSIVTIASFFIAVSFYLLYNEKLLTRHVIGISLMISGVFAIALSKSQDQDLGGIHPSIMVPICLCILQCFFLTMCAIILRQVSHRGYEPIQFSQDSFMVAGIIYFVLFLYSQIKLSQNGYAIDAHKFLIISVAGLFLILGSTFQNIALKTGRGGVVMAIVQCQSLFQFIFEVFLQFRVPSIYELIALSLSTVGVTIASLRD